MIELTGVLELDTPHGRGRALFFDGAGNDSDPLWYVVHETGALLCYRNRDVRIAPNFTLNVRRDEIAARLEKTTRGTKTCLTETS